MPTLNNKPAITKFQVGETVHYMESNLLKTGIIKKIETIINNPLNDSTGKQINLYYFLENSLSLTEDKIFPTKNLLLKYLKGDYVVDFSNLDFGSSNLSGKDFSGCNLSGADLTQIDTNINALDVRGANLEGASIYEGLDTKEEFTLAVGLYDSSTIWIDGTSLIEE